MTTYMICNLIGLSSTCTKPILYGYLNKNIQEVVMQRISEFFYAVNVSFSKSSINSTRGLSHWKLTDCRLLTHLRLDPEVIFTIKENQFRTLYKAFTRYYSFVRVTALFKFPWIF